MKTSWAATLKCCFANLGGTAEDSLLSLNFCRDRRFFYSLEEKPEYIQQILQYGSEKARIEGAKTLEEVKEAMSIKYF